MRRSKKILLIILAVLLAICVILAVAMGLYIADSYGGDETATGVIANPSENVTVVQNGDTIAFVPEGDIEAGIVFYPGAKIHADAYAPLADKLAEEGYLCVLVSMPLNMSLLDEDAALDVTDNWPDVEDWYIAGHSMGGLAAEKCAEENPEAFDGLIVLAGRVRYDFSDSDLPVLAIYATEDGLCTPELVEEEETPEPQYYTEVMIDGGCHGYFGYYGKQFMDGTPTITREDQQEQTLEAITAFLEETDGE